jgi:hypothetical protein
MTEASKAETDDFRVGNGRKRAVRGGFINRSDVYISFFS